LEAEDSINFVGFKSALIDLIAGADQKGLRGWADCFNGLAKVEAIALLQLIRADQNADRIFVEHLEAAFGIGSHVANQVGIPEGQNQGMKLILPLHGDGDAGLDSTSDDGLKENFAALH
jgi:hypothetical protein